MGLLDTILGLSVHGRLMGAVRALEEGNFYEAIGGFRHCAERGDVTAQCTLAHMYLNGQGVAVTPEQALKWASLAAKQGSPFGMYLIGLIYADPNFGMRNPEAARVALRNALQNKEHPIERGGISKDGVRAARELLMNLEFEAARTCGSRTGAAWYRPRYAALSEFFELYDRARWEQTGMSAEQINDLKFSFVREHIDD